MSTVDPAHKTPHKVHIRGVDDLTTEDLKDFSAEHFPSEPPLRVEWIDDTSANIVYDTPATALKALKSFSIWPTDDSPDSTLQLRAAKTFSSHPESSLQVRTALFTDQKGPRAHDASRFYMMHPEYDPRERGRRDRSNRSGHGNYLRRRYGYEEHRRRNEGDNRDGYSDIMYDDDPSIPARREKGISTQRTSQSPRSSLSTEDRNTAEIRRNKARYQVDSYRPRRSSSKDQGARNRSASPSRHIDDRPGRPGQRNPRRRTPPPPYQAHDPYPTPSENLGKELFPSKSVPVANQHSKERELFPDKRSAANSKKELFPNKLTSSNHRRSDAFDAADETADHFVTGLSAPLTDNALKPRHDLTDKLSKSQALSYGRLRSSDLETEPMALEVLNEGGLNIRGASQMQDLGFSIRGAADNTSNKMHVKELFPEKVVGNAGKELFAEKLQGRGGKRNKAEDMFY